jgi:hypothetical protein
MGMVSLFLENIVFEIQGLLHPMRRTYFIFERNPEPLDHTVTIQCT